MALIWMYFGRVDVVVKSERNIWLIQKNTEKSEDRRLKENKKDKHP